jgi:hypothetical protein
VQAVAVAAEQSRLAYGLECELMLTENAQNKEEKAAEAAAESESPVYDRMGISHRYQSDKAAAAHEKVQPSMADASNSVPAPSSYDQLQCHGNNASDTAAHDDDLVAAALRLPSNEQPMRELLAIDAALISNVARFINHSCQPNLIVQV